MGGLTEFSPARLKKSGDSYTSKNSTQPSPSKSLDIGRRRRQQPNEMPRVHARETIAQSRRGDVLFVQNTVHQLTTKWGIYISHNKVLLCFHGLQHMPICMSPLPLSHTRANKGTTMTPTTHSPRTSNSYDKKNPPQKKKIKKLKSQDC